jgi:hypothetical protein
MYWFEYGAMFSVIKPEQQASARPNHDEAEIVRHKGEFPWENSLVPSSYGQGA